MEPATASVTVYRHDMLLIKTGLSCYTGKDCNHLIVYSPPHKHRYPTPATASYLSDLEALNPMFNAPVLFNEHS
jgi:hypothetical protein